MGIKWVFSLALYLHSKSNSLLKTLKDLEFSKTNMLQITFSRVTLITTRNLVTIGLVILKLCNDKKKPKCLVAIGLVIFEW